jgi:hypothetical protein
MSVPSEFVPYHRPSRFLDLIGPVYESANDLAVVSLRIDERHTNARVTLVASGVCGVARPPDR